VGLPALAENKFGPTTISGKAGPALWAQVLWLISVTPLRAVFFRFSTMRGPAPGTRPVLYKGTFWK
jgi:hypothetical protein